MSLHIYMYIQIYRYLSPYLSNYVYLDPNIYILRSVMMENTNLISSFSCIRGQVQIFMGEV